MFAKIIYKLFIYKYMVEAAGIEAAEARFYNFLRNSKIRDKYFSDFDLLTLRIYQNYLEFIRVFS